MARDLMELTGELGPRAQKLAYTLSGIGPLRRAAAALEKAIKLELSQPGSGRIYRRLSVTHQASAPGEPPAVDTGRLRASVGQQELPGVAAIRVGTNAEYAAALNFGYDFGTHVLAPRPFMEPALSKARADMIDSVTADLRVAGEAAL